MRRVVVTGMGIWSCVGQDLQTVTESFKQGKSGVTFDPKRIEHGLQSGLVGNVPRPDFKHLLSRDNRVIMPEDAEYAYMAAKQAIEQAVISDEYRKNHDIGVIWANDGNSRLKEVHQVMNLTKDSQELGIYHPIYTSCTKVCLSKIFNLRGTNFCVSSACASGSHAIGLAYFLIKTGVEDMILTGGSMEMDSFYAESFDALQATSLRNNNPYQASRPFDKDRDGMVPSGGAAALVLEEYEHAMARGATILAEVVGYGFSSNGIEEISMPSADAEYIAMKRAIEDAGLQPEDIDYVNAHGTSTIAGDIEEAEALTRLFSQKSKVESQKPFISSTKSMTGHENWMAGASEAVYSILMMQNNFVAPNINLENKIDEAKDLNIVTETVYTPIRTVLSNSSGMGGTNSALVFRKID